MITKTIEPLTIWCNTGLSLAVRERLVQAAAPHPLLFADQHPDGLAQADIAFGQPSVETVMASERLCWVHLSTAGYTAYDRDDVRQSLQARGAALTNSSHVYDEPCAQHALAMLLGFARQLPQATDDQRDPAPPWKSGLHRRNSFLLGPQTTVLLLGFGAIGQRLAHLLAPFGMRIIAVRRKPVSGDDPLNVQIIGEKDLAGVLPEADQIINILPESPSTGGYVSAERLALFKPGAFFYNIGRGATVDQNALLVALQSGHLAGAYLDVTSPEPLPPDHPLWTAPNCWITPHSAGGHANEADRLADHFLANLRAWERGEPLTDRVF